MANPSENLARAKTKLIEEGWCVLPDVLAGTEASAALGTLWKTAEAWAASGGDTFMKVLDPNASNVRVFNLIGLDPLFRDLILHEAASELVEALLGPDFMISNFTANIARPGSGSMSLHSDQALVVPEPWLEPWSINIIWCLSDVSFENGATLFIPGSHKVRRLEELGEKPRERLTPFEAKAGSIIAMDGRVWHTSGKNITADQDRALLFGYYSRGFLRPQVNWNVVLPADVQNGLQPELRQRLGLDASANTAVGAHILAAGL
ncbi:MAG TPA: hypothetical protein EYG02_13710 [Henriciella marina]|uniref:phytanoyl-CoA dioxygenase family protein n=1 Tax=Henriciella sp. TaxID=1968823 RepID=UPI001821169C|nr:phytanoyl-CoA dioxygenase family protein [Henriciella sp.]HIG23298.1 hypothetical protein [Henriciella sp.]HIK66065.1 hypothetical protein [Henriciella marina]